MRGEPEALLALAQRFLGTLAGVDILQRSVPADRIARLVEPHRGTRAEPAIAAVGGGQPIFEVERRPPRDRGGPDRGGARPVAGMQRVEPHRSHRGARIEAGHLGPARADRIDLAIRRRGPADLRIEFHRVAIMRLALAQPRLGVVTVGDVLRDGNRR